MIATLAVADCTCVAGGKLELTRSAEGMQEVRFTVAPGACVCTPVAATIDSARLYYKVLCQLPPSFSRGYLDPKCTTNAVTGTARW